MLNQLLTAVARTPDATRRYDVRIQRVLLLQLPSASANRALGQPRGLGDRSDATVPKGHRFACGPESPRSLIQRAT